MTADLEMIHSLTPVRNELPGEPVPYYLASGRGDRYEIDGQLWTIIARSTDTGGLFDAAYIRGGRGANTPFHAHAREHRTFLVVEGSVQIWLGSSSRILVQGDSVHVPPGVPIAYRMLSHLTRLLTWAAPGGSLLYVEQQGDRVDAHIQPARPRHRTSRLSRQAWGEPLGITFPLVEQVIATHEWDHELPSDASAYYLRAGEGHRVAMTGALYTYMTRGANTDHRYFAVTTLGGPADYFVRHFHRRHTENFICLSGRVWLYVNGHEVLLTEGDFVHAPAGTIHTFAFDAENTKMLGILTPDVFEDFFELLGEPTDYYVHDEDAGLVLPPPEALARAQAELDLVVVGPPPKRAVGLNL